MIATDSGLEPLDPICRICSIETIVFSDIRCLQRLRSRILRLPNRQFSRCHHRARVCKGAEVSIINEEDSSRMKLQSGKYSQGCTCSRRNISSSCSLVYDRRFELYASGTITIEVIQVGLCLALPVDRHCYVAGKDRTGIVAGILLKACRPCEQTVQRLKSDVARRRRRLSHVRIIPSPE
ncbi:hypothetical protein BDN67DRAFT_510732 [Paxillus ammoniavirescens]|nr:hypothetical protein BDN67DRAFT_510732 [Paxillus ammoniavirescens]